jgi:hypothetical protein
MHDGAVTCLNQQRQLQLRPAHVCWSTDPMQAGRTSSPRGVQCNTITHRAVPTSTITPEGAAPPIPVHVPLHANWHNMYTDAATINHLLSLGYTTLRSECLR